MPRFSHPSPSVNTGQSVLLADLQGAKLSVLVALLVSPSGLAHPELRRITGYSYNPVSDALDYLARRGLVAVADVSLNRPVWKLAAHGRQLFLGEAAPELLEVRGAVCMEVGKESAREIDSTNTRVLTIRGPLEGPARDIFALGGVSADRAEEAVRLAGERLGDPDAVPGLVSAWIEYVKSPRSRSIARHGPFVVSRVAEGIFPPDAIAPSGEDLSRYDGYVVSDDPDDPPAD